VSRDDGRDKRGIALDVALKRVMELEGRVLDNAYTIERLHLQRQTAESKVAALQEAVRCARYLITKGSLEDEAQWLADPVVAEALKGGDDAPK
jgi:hypothetical protein